MVSDKWFIVGYFTFQEEVKEKEEEDTVSKPPAVNFASCSRCHHNNIDSPVNIINFTPSHNNYSVTTTELE